MLTREQSLDLNIAIEKLCDNDDLPAVIGMGESGKRIPYIGWYWRPIDFTLPVRFGRCRVGGPTITEQVNGSKGPFAPFVPAWAGFMENNKWDYPAWTTTPEQTDEVIARLQAAVADPTQRRLQAVYDYIQSIMPDYIREWDGRTGYDDWLAEQAVR